MATLRTILRQVPDPRGKQGRRHPLEALLGLMLLSMLSGRKGMLAACTLGRSLTRRQLRRMGFREGHGSPCHATLTETLRALDPDALIEVFSQLSEADCEAVRPEARHLSIDGKTMRASKDADGRAEHVLSAFCVTLGQSVGHTASRGKGMEIPDALRLLDRLDLENTVVTGDAIFCQRSIASAIVAKGGGYVLPVKKNQKDLHEDIETAFNMPVFPPRSLDGAAAAGPRENRSAQHRPAPCAGAQSVRSGQMAQHPNHRPNNAHP